jgi:Tol biopolymer transport system component
MKMLLAALALAHVWTPAAITTDQYEATPTFTPDGRQMYFMLSDPQFERYRLMMSRCVNGAWSAPVPASFARPGVQEGDPGITPDGKRLYFISMRHDPSGEIVREDFDIWYVQRRPDGAWGEAQRLPEPVNSRGSELLPRADRDGRLYFGSDRSGGLGRSDIYVAMQASGGEWSVRNVGAPVSSAANEYEAEISQDGRTLVAVIDRGDRSHLYRFERQGERWIERGRIPARANVFQVGPLLSPNADRLLFAQAEGVRSGELFLIDLAQQADARWPPCATASSSF